MTGERYVYCHLWSSHQAWSIWCHGLYEVMIKWLCFHGLSSAPGLASLPIPSKRAESYSENKGYLLVLRDEIIYNWKIVPFEFQSHRLHASAWVRAPPAVCCQCVPWRKPKPPPPQPHTRCHWVLHFKGTVSSAPHHFLVLCLGETRPPTPFFLLPSFKAWILFHLSHQTFWLLIHWLRENPSFSWKFL